jgi:hypothetical protein
LFAPVNRPDASRLSLNKDLPRPFVLIPDDAPAVVEAGQEFSFAARLFGDAVVLHPYIAAVFSRLVEEGFGRDRVRCGIRQPDAPRQCVLDLAIPPNAAANIEMEIAFITPTYLKHEGREVRSGRDAFAPLVKRARDRLSSLYHFYEPSGPELPWDFASIGKLAESAVCLDDRTQWADRQRRSTRTGQLHDLSGLTGVAVYQGVPTVIERLLDWAAITHVGKHAAFGLGRIAVRRRDG